MYGGAFATAGSQHTSPISPAYGGATSIKRTLSQSSDSAEEGVEGNGCKRKAPGVKRACNECRQQKLRCDVVQDPTYKSCSRCIRHKLECKIDSTFKRVGKRSRNAEMEREIQELRRQLAAQRSYASSGPPSIKAAASDTASPRISSIPSQLEQYISSEQAVNSLIELRSGPEGAGQQPMRPNWRLEGITLSQDQVDELFRRFFTLFHPFAPLLEPKTTPAAYHKGHALLFWVIISVAARHYPPEPNLLPSLSNPISKLLWATLADVPQNYIVVKALCILCTWPLPISQTSHDPTFMLAGTMMQIAMQIGLHRPSHAQDFARFKVEFREEELKDRVKTWVACNMISQRVATGYGQPPSIVYDWTLVPSSVSGGHYQLPREIQIRLDIERFCNKVTKSFYTNRLDSVGLVDDEQRSVMAGFLSHDFEELEGKFDDGISMITRLYLRAAGLHFRLSAFFDSPESSEYQSHLYSLWHATTAFLECVFDLNKIDGGLVPHASNYILQMIVAAGFTLLKLLNSFFADKIDSVRGRELFMKTIRAIRTISVATNDLPSRLAEVLAQLWKSGGSGTRNGHVPSTSVDNSLQLKVRCRMSMSLVHDSVWRWREAFQTKGPDKLEAAVKNPTNPDSNVESSASSTVNDSGLGTTSNSIGINSGLPSEAFSATGSATSMFGDPYESNYEVFDPQMWLLDGLGNFPFDEVGWTKEKEGVEASVAGFAGTCWGGGSVCLEGLVSAQHISPPVTDNSPGIICLFSISGQYGFLQRLLFYLLLTFAVVAHRQEWLIRGSLAAAMTYSASASVHAVVIAATSQKHRILDLDIVGVYCITSSSIIILGPMLDWCHALRESKARPIVVAWGIVVSAGVICTRVMLERRWLIEEPCFSSTDGLLLHPSQLAAGGFNCTYQGFQRLSPIRASGDILAVASDRVFGRWYDILLSLNIMTLVMMSLSLLSVLSIMSGEPRDELKRSEHKFSWRHGYQHIKTSISFNSTKGFLVTILFGVLAPIAFVLNVVLSEIYIKQHPSLPVDEESYAVGQWAPWVSAGFVLAAAAIAQINVALYDE
ncbi:MAG: hypothetical protein L6R37_005386 [Teloschistes peruensis]|nr:MAG: hypothetical protein L6R37_005386 [Teloschistes peruensis]